MLKKKEVGVTTIEYLSEDLPIIIKYRNQSYLINKIIDRQDNFVFNLGGIGTKWTIRINNKETNLYRDKHNMKWHVYIHVNGPKQFQSDEDLIEVNDIRYLR